MINKVLATNIFAILFFCALLAYFNYSFTENNRSDHFYIFQEAKSSGTMALQAFFSFFLINNSFIPIDLAVGLEMGKFMYIYFLQNDVHMTVFDEAKRDLVGCSVKNFNLHEDLAQLDYMFCDKTGTLTKNELIFKAFKVLGPPQANMSPREMSP